MDAAAQVEQTHPISFFERALASLGLSARRGGSLCRVLKRGRGVCLRVVVAVDPVSDAVLNAILNPIREAPHRFDVGHVLLSGLPLTELGPADFRISSRLKWFWLGDRGLGDGKCDEQQRAECHFANILVHHLFVRRIRTPEPVVPCRSGPECPRWRPKPEPRVIASEPDTLKAP